MRGILDHPAWERGPSQCGKMIDHNSLEHCIATKPGPTFVRNALGVLMVWLGATVQALSQTPALPSGQAAASSDTLFQNVRVFDGRSERLSGPTDVMVRGKTITSIGPSQQHAAGTAVIDGRGRTLMPGLIDVHVHLTFSSMPMMRLLRPDLTPQIAEQQAAAASEAMLMRGFTSVRDAGGPVFGLKAGIDAGKYRGPRIWPSGATISQTSGHGDFRTPDEPSRRFTGQQSRAEKLGAAFIVDGRADVLTATRENLRFGASQIKLMAGGGTSSAYDPLDVTQYTLDEMRAAVEAAEDWGTYVMVHAYNPRAVRRAVEAGVKVIEHGQLLDEATLRFLAERGVWLSLQTLMADSPNMEEARRVKRRPVIEGQDFVWPLAKRLGVKLAWGTDFLFEPEINSQQNSYILRLRPWFTPAEILKLVTHDNAQLLALSGLRSPYSGRLGVIEEGALADLILVNGDPIANLELVADPERSFAVIMKDGILYKNAP
jgi:imidazolonepropionase-like amidohydrolase